MYLKLISILIYGIGACEVIASDNNTNRFWPDTNAFKVSLHVWPQTILPLEPVDAMVTIENTSQQEQTINLNTFSSFSICEDTNTWQSYSEYQYGLYPAAPVPRPRVIRPGEIIVDWACFDVNSKKEAVFLKPGTYFVRAQTYFGNSAAEKIIVLPLPTNEATAFGFVVEHRLNLFFSEDITRVGVSISNPNTTLTNGLELNTFATSFPNSSYAQWTAVGALWIKRFQTEKTYANSPERKTSELATVQTEFETAAKKMTGDARLRCLSGAANIANERGDKNKATEMCEKILNETPDSVIAARVKRSGLSNRND